MKTTQTQQKIDRKFGARKDFLPFIEQVRFPEYKSLDENLTLSFDWPITALVGPNGTNKSSVLQALSAAPEGRSLAPFWFSTAVDDIDNGVGGKTYHRFIYSYSFSPKSTDPRAECRKYRGSKKYRNTEVPRALQGKRDPDYWEPTKRVAYDHMAPIPPSGFEDHLSANRDRWNQIDKNVVFLDFRSELSAFDKFIHHESFQRWTSDSVQKRHRAVLRSKYVAHALEGKELPEKYAAKVIEPVRELGASTVETIARILGKPIGSISMVNHSLFGPSGYTIRIRLDRTGANYSEAHAGSGEYAVVRLVEAIERAPERSLILLDEPEVSLHPGAQIELLNFLEREVLRHGHQVVLSTHSPSLVKHLPPEAIKVFGFDPKSQDIILVAEGCTANVAFFHLGQATADTEKPRLIVEDELAREIVLASLRRTAPAKLDGVSIVPFPGGAPGIVKNALPIFALSGLSMTAILLDGDQVPPSGPEGTQDAPGSPQMRPPRTTLQDLEVAWKSNIHETLPFLHSNSDHGADLESMQACTSWAASHLGFLPSRSPEQAVAEALWGPFESDVPDWKTFWKDHARETLRLATTEAVSADQILSHQVSCLADLPDDSPLFLSVSETVSRILAI